MAAETEEDKAAGEQQVTEGPTNQDPNDEKTDGDNKQSPRQSQLNRAFGHLKRKFPHADPVEMVAKMEKDMASYPSFVAQGRHKFFCHVQVSSDTIAWLKEVAGIICK